MVMVMKPDDLGKMVVTAVELNTCGDHDGSDNVAIDYCSDNGEGNCCISRGSDSVETGQW